MTKSTSAVDPMLVIGGASNKLKEVLVTGAREGRAFLHCSMHY